jgi:hypothetical protein
MKGEYSIPYGEQIHKLLKDLVASDLWFLNTKTQTIVPNSKSTQKAMEMFTTWSRSKK